MPRRLASFLRGLFGPYGDPAGRLTLFAGIAMAVIVVEHLTRLAVLAWLPLGTDWAGLVGPLGVGRSDHHMPGMFAELGWSYAARLPFVLLAVLVAGHLPLMRRWAVIGSGLIVGGAVANLWSVAMTGYVANWLGIRIGDAAMFYVPADLAQVAGMAMAFSLGCLIFAWWVAGWIRELALRGADA